MNNFKIFCTSINYYRILDKMPDYIYPLGLGKNHFPSHWLIEKNGENILNLNKFYGELSGIFWIWKNMSNQMNLNDKIGICHYRKFWLNDLFFQKQKFSTKSLNSQLLNKNNSKILFHKNIQVQPITFKNKDLLFDFREIHKSNILEESIDFLDKDFQLKFKNHLKNNIFYPLNMFITTVQEFNRYCEVIFPWLEKCLKICLEQNLCQGYNTRLPAFLAERFTSFWFSKESDNAQLSYARLGKYLLSNKLNLILNPTKIPFTFRMYPTIHRY
jgi:hypothetical protein